MSIRRAVAACLGVVVMAATALVATAIPAAAADDPPCYGWRRLIHGQTGLNAVVEPGAPWHVRLASGGNGFQNFMICELGIRDGVREVAFSSNAHGYLGFNDDIETMVRADTEMYMSDSYWYVCYLDAMWVEISAEPFTEYLGPNSAGYLTADHPSPNGNTLFHRSQFNNLNLFPCW